MDTEDRDRSVLVVSRSLEDWKEVLVVLKGVLDWEQPYHPGVIFGVVSLDFLVLGWWEPTWVALAALTLLLLVLADVAVPFLAPRIIPLEAWGSRQQHQFQQVCEGIVGVGDDFSAAWKACADLKSQRPRVYLGLSTLGLLLTAWLGSTLGDAFLLYLIVLGLALYPGAKRNGIVDAYFADVTAKLKDVVFKPKTR